MDTIRDLADQSIRRACAFASLGIGVVMLALSFDLLLACRAGAALTGMLCLGLAVAGWRAPYRDVRSTELWMLLASTASDLAASLPRARAQAVLSAVLRERLLWHADRIGLLALSLWGLAVLVMVLRFLFGG